ncbi:MAG: hypothetical protein ABF888_11675 [Acetobacter papayae]
MGLNLFTLAGALCAQAVPPQAAVLHASTGSTVNADGSVTPLYTATPVQIVVQPPGPQDLQLVEGLGQQAELRVVYVNAPVHALSRTLQTGGDILEFSGSDWLVTRSVEDWAADTSGESEWVKVVVTRQLPASA